MNLGKDKDLLLKDKTKLKMMPQCTDLWHRPHNVVHCRRLFCGIVQSIKILRTKNA